MLGGLLAVQFALLAPALVTPDLNLDYPFMAGDSWDWIANGLTHAGERVRYSGRPPLLPLLLALFERLGVLRLWPLANLALAQAAILLWYALARAVTSPRAAFAAACCLAVSQARLENALWVMADSLAATLLLAAAAAFVAAQGRARWHLAAGLAGGLSAVTQAAALLLPLPVALAVVLARKRDLRWPRRRDLRSPWLWAGAACFVALPGAWWLWQRLGPLGPGLGAHAQLLRPHLDGLGFYLFAALAWSGVPAACGIAIGSLWWLRGERWRDGNRLFLAALAVVMALFFAVLYDYRDQRLWLYAWFPASLFLADALGRVRRAPVLWALAGLCAATAALPLPPGGQGWAAVWPVPPLYAQLPLDAAATGSAEPAGAPAVVRRPWSALREDWLPARARAARRQHQPSPRLDGALLGGAAGAVFLFDERDRGHRYLELTRLANALRAPVKFLPVWWLAPTEPRLTVRPVGRHDRYQVFRAAVAGLPGDWLLVGAPGGAAQRRLEGLANATALPDAAPAGLSEALSVRDFLAAPRVRQIAILDAEGSDWAARLYLPLVLDTTEIAVVAPPDEGALLEFLNHPALEQARTFGATRVERRQLRGAPGAILRPAG